MDPRILDRLRRRLAAASDGTVGSLAAARGWITLDQLRECLRLQATSAPDQPLGFIFVSRGYLTPEQLAELVLSK
ncbi:MAG: hypothetical protein HY716_03445 [Planctomycetes bacterium]|nr:hypothetical protein [Planctomycetota bacterium]